MKNACMLFLLVCLSSSLLGQNQIKIAQDEDQATSISFLPELIKGDFAPNITAIQMAEMLRMQRVLTNQGMMHEAFNENPHVIADGILADANMFENLKNYLSAENLTDRLIYENLLLELY